MAIRGWDEDAKKQRKLLCDVDGILRTKPEGVYLTADPTLVNLEQHRLRLTVDGKLMVDDPTTQAAVAAVEVKVDDVEAKLDVPANFMADVSGVETEVSAAARYAAIIAYIDDVETFLGDPGHGLAALETLLGAIPTTPELEADADTRYDALIAAIGAISAGVTFTDYHDYENLAAAATYTPPAQSESTLHVQYGRMATDRLNTMFYDGADWVEAWAFLIADEVHDGPIQLFQDNDQNVRIINDDTSARKISLTGHIWS